MTSYEKVLLIIGIALPFLYALARLTALVAQLLPDNKLRKVLLYISNDSRLIAQIAEAVVKSQAPSAPANPSAQPDPEAGKAPVPSADPALPAPNASPSQADASAAAKD